jgi:hypothetical protein
VVLCRVIRATEHDRRAGEIRPVMPITVMPIAMMPVAMVPVPVMAMPAMPMPVMSAPVTPVCVSASGCKTDNNERGSAYDGECQSFP